MSRVLVTGSSRGIGRAITTELAARGHEVVATARDASTLADLPVAERIDLDVTDQASVDRAVAAAGEIDALVSNAGDIFLASVEESPVDALEALLDLNTLGPLRVAQALLPGMRERGHGRLIFMSSIVGRMVLPGNAGYASTKWALEALVEALAGEVEPFGLHATLLEPGAVASGALDDPRSYIDEDGPYAEAIRELRAGLRGSMMEPEEVARATADAVEAEHPPLRIPVGDAARAILEARRAAPDDRPFRPGAVGAETA